MLEQADKKDAAAHGDAGRGLEIDMVVAALIVLALEIAGRLAFHAAVGRPAAWAPWSQFPADSGHCMVFVGALRAVQAGAALLFMSAVRGRPLASLGLGAKGAALGVVAGLVFCALLTAGLAAWSAAGPSFPWMPSIRAAFGEPPFGSGPAAVFVSGIIAFVVAGPLAEEIAFRGLVYGAVRKPFGVFAAAAVSTCLFAAAHIGGPWPIYVAGGAAFAVLRERTHSLFSPLIAHAAGNAIILLFVLAAR